MNIPQLTAKGLRRAASIMDKMDGLQKELVKLIGDRFNVGNGVTSQIPADRRVRRKRKVSAATRAKMKAAWAKRRATASKK
jgi:hypothetical protein